MKEQKQQPEGEKSPEQLRKEKLAQEMVAKQLLYKGINIPYIASQRDEKGHATDITEDKPYSHTSLSTRNQRRGHSRPVFSIFQDRIVTNFERKTSSGHMLKKIVKGEKVNDVKIQGWVKA